MKYFYTKLGPMVNGRKILRLAVGGTPFSWCIEGFDDPRVKAGSIEPITRYTGYLDIEEPDEPDTLPEQPPPEQPELPLDEGPPLS